MVAVPAVILDSVTLNGTTAVPELGAYALIVGCFGLGAVMMRRRR
ncbi:MULTISPECIES: hypothetical protein [unclassified Lentimonas]|nr:MULTISPECIES: hypothetical protein [unclassified Lentimonas]CAA6676316.1 Unannotated [Lentimonas sp. CC4]CAA6683794.1 Unannotated [Lentimonas sp. CC6]CAA7077811.1 Unannotated [Lentimonas sp. CC4]CAA7169741.1 Unannotated [Lentimonas sp. CC21]CAA7179858.1 Unannotated [Lentimonas sp. CC8]